MSLRFSHFYHFSPKLKPFESGSLWFQFCCHFHPKAKLSQIFQLTSKFFNDQNMLKMIKTFSSDQHHIENDLNLLKKARY
ncbi:hypothetical protein Hanom_Chr05g00449741 [Helianthus anomalus]